MCKSAMLAGRRWPDTFPELADAQAGSVQSTQAHRRVEGTVTKVRTTLYSNESGNSASTGHREAQVWRQAQQGEKELWQHGGMPTGRAKTHGSAFLSPVCHTGLAGRLPPINLRKKQMFHNCPSVSCNC